jgi:2-oxoisovalerate dehydrogenase E1 component
MAFQVFLIREFEQMLLNLYADNCMHGPLHASIGQEACAAGSIGGLQPADKVSGSHRSHHIYLSKIIGYYFADGLTDYKQLPDDVQQEITSVMGEIMGLANGCCQGRGGSMHLFNKKIGMIGSNAIVSGGVPAAAGAAFADQYNKQDSVTISYTGDGGVNQGAFHEALNLAGVWKLPFICFIENNQYAVATSVADSTATEDLAVKAVAYGMKGLIVDGMDPMAVRKAVLIAGDHARAGNGATLLEAKCYRYQHHGGGSAKGSQFGYRDTDEEDAWVKRDPFSCYPEKLIELGLVQADEIDDLKQLARSAVEAAVDACTYFEDNHYTRREELWPKVETIYEGSRSDGREFEGVAHNEIEDFADRKTVTYVGAIAGVTGRQMEKDENVVVFGEEVANLGGGAYGATKGLYKIYPGRIVNTPISEGGFTGLAGGAALMGLKPVVELMFSDFGLVAADQLFNQIGKLRFMYGNASRMPIIVRTRVAIGGGYGGQHSSDPVGLYSLYSGWRIVAPSNAFDYIGLFNTAMLSEDPVLISEHHTLYPVKSEIPTGNLDYFIPFGKARRIVEGSDVTVLCYSSTVGLVAKAIEGLEAEGVSAEVIDLRTISLGDIDYEAIGASLKKTKAMVIVEQAQASCAIGPRLSHECQQRFFDYLDGPITTVNGLDIPLPVSKRLEDAAVPNAQQARDMIVKTARRRI